MGFPDEIRVADSEREVTQGLILLRNLVDNVIQVSSSSRDERPDDPGIWRANLHDEDVLPMAQPAEWQNGRQIRGHHAFCFVDALLVGSGNLDAVRVAIEPMSDQ